MSALGKGAANAAFDAIGLFPEGAGVTNTIQRVVGHQFGYRGVVADQIGMNALRAVDKSKGALEAGEVLVETTPDEITSAALFAFSWIPVAEQLVAGATVGFDIYKTWKAIAQCN